MVGDGKAHQLLEVRAIEGSNSLDYVRSVIKAIQDGLVAAVVPTGPVRRHIPGARIVERISPREEFGWLDGLPTINEESFNSSANAAFIAFSSGTTGRPKAIALSGRSLTNVVSRLNDVMEVDNTIREYIGVPVNFSFGFARARAVCEAGGRAYLPKHAFNPSEIAKMLSNEEINAVSAVPTLWRIALQNSDLFDAGRKKLRWIEIGSQFMSGAEKSALRDLFPNAKIIQHYGLTEASRSTFLDVSAVPGDHLESIGQGFGDAEIALSDENHLKVRGPHVAMGTLSGAGIRTLVDEEGWLKTNDLGDLKDGYFYFKGRADDLINCGGTKVPAEQFENKLLTALGSTNNEIAVGRIYDDLRGERILIAKHKNSELDLVKIKEISTGIADEYGLTGAAALSFGIAGDFPKTQTGKLKRAALSDVVTLPPTTDTPSTSVPIGIYHEGAAGDARHVKSDTDLDQQKLADELRNLWEECLGVSPVELTDNFYDLGGDSLSAVSVMIRMERLGISSDAAAKIFEGKSIAEIVSPEADVIPKAALELAEPHKTPPEPLTNDKNATALIAIWEECLGITPISTNESFFDLGGDSLSAVNVLLRMERLGIDPEVAKGIFEGRTISEIVGSPTSIINYSSERTAPPIQRSEFMSLAGAINTVNAVRGLLIYWVIAVHWLPGVFNRLPGNWDGVLYSLNPLFRLGTPGFALVFGLGVGALRVHQYQRNSERFGATVLRNSLFMLVGVGLFSAFLFGDYAVNGHLDDPIIISRIFYSALTFYVLVAMTEGLIIKTATQTTSIMLNFLVLAVFSMILFEILKYFFEGPSTQGIQDLVRLIATSKYGYFNMLAAVLVGAAIGYDFRNRHKSPNLVRDYTLAGCGLFAFGAFLSLQIDSVETLFTMTTIAPWHLIAYSGVIIFFLAAIAVLNKNSPPLGVFRQVNRALIASGMLALPLFVGHEIVRPAMSMLAAIGVPGNIALSIPLVIFIGLIALAYRKIYQTFLR